MTRTTQRGRRLSGRFAGLAAFLLTLAVAGTSYGFGGHPAPAPPPAPSQGGEIPGVPNDNPGEIPGPPTEDPGDIPPILVLPDPGDLNEPPIGGGEGEGPPAPGETNSPAETPEPATLLMGLLGAAGVAGARAWKRRGQVK